MQSKHKNMIDFTNSRHIETVYNEYSTQFIRYAEWHLRNTEDAEDLVMIVLSDTSRYKKKFRTYIDAVKYIFKSIGNRCIDKKEVNSTRIRHMRNYGYTVNSIEIGGITLLEQEEAYNAVLEACDEIIGKMPRLRRQAFIERYKKGRENNDIAGEFGVTSKTIRNSLSHAYQDLRSQFKHHPKYRRVFNERHYL